MTDSAEGKALPELELPATEVGKVSIPEDFKGQWSLLYFYPKDDTPGCTKQACAYRDDLDKFREAGVQLFGVSMDDLDSHAAFKDKFSLNFPLICDPGHQLADVLGVYGEQEVKGFKYTGLSRDTFLIDPEAKVARAFRQVDPETTARETFDALMQAKQG